VWLQAVVQRCLGDVLTLDDQVGLLEPGRHVATYLLLHLAGDVAVRMDSGSIRLEGGIGVHHKRQRLVLDIDQAQRILGDLLGVGRHRRHLLTDVAHDLREQLSVLKPGDAGRVVAAQHRPHAVERLSLRRVDPHDPGMRTRTPQDFGVELAWQAHVVGVLRLAGNLQVAFDTRNRFPDHPEVGVARPGVAGVPLDNSVLILAISRLLALDTHQVHRAAAFPVPARVVPLVAPLPVDPLPERFSPAAETSSTARSPALTMF
jgi:hypothetical protein